MTDRALQLAPCGECGMPCYPAEFHPFAACLMFKACHNSETVRANLAALSQGAPEGRAPDRAVAIAFLNGSAPLVLPAWLWCGQQAAPSLTKQLQQKCSDWGTYWRAPDAHGVILSPKQAVELLQDALGVEVEIEQQAAPSEAPAWPTEMKIADVGFLWDDKAQCHIPTLLLKFEPVPANAPCDAKGWADRDAMAKLLASPPSAQPAEKL